MDQVIGQGQCPKCGNTTHSVNRFECQRCPPTIAKQDKSFTGQCPKCGRAVHHCMDFLCSACNTPSLDQNDLEELFDDNSPETPQEFIVPQYEKDQGFSEEFRKAFKKFMQPGCQYKYHPSDGSEPYLFINRYDGWDFDSSYGFIRALSNIGGICPINLMDIDKIIRGSAAKPASEFVDETCEMTATDQPKLKSEYNTELPLTPPAVFAMEQAKAEVRRHNHCFISTGHVLLGLFTDGIGIASEILQKYGIEICKVRHTFEKLYGNDGNIPDPAPPCIPLQFALQAAESYAKEDGSSYIGSEHLLLGILHPDFSVGAAIRVLKTSGINVDKLRDFARSYPTSVQKENEVPLKKTEISCQKDDTPTTYNTELPWTPGALQAMEWAKEEAQHLSHTQLTAGHILLALIRSFWSAAKLLYGFGVEYDKAQRILGGIACPLRGLTPDTFPIEGNIKLLIKRFEAEAKKRGDTVITTKHLLFVILSNEGCYSAGRVLNRLGVNIAKLIEALEQKMSPVKSTWCNCKCRDF